MWLKYFFHILAGTFAFSWVAYLLVAKAEMLPELLQSFYNDYPNLSCFAASFLATAVAAAYGLLQKEKAAIEQDRLGLED